MSGVNCVHIVGRLGQDPELKYFQDGAAVCNFSMATSEEWKDKTTGEKKQKTEWHKINAFRRLGEICGEYLAKGKLVYVTGKLQTETWQDKEGNKRSTTKIIASNMQMLESRAESQSHKQDNNQGDLSEDLKNKLEGKTKEDDIPF